MNIALIFAGGTGTRMEGAVIPKQFLEIEGKPILIHTIEHFERHSEIDHIAVVCVAEWIGELRTLIGRFGIKKVRWIVAGGDTGQESRHKGLLAIRGDIESPEDTIVLLHDGVRPLINAALITNSIDTVKRTGSAVAVTPAVETVMMVDETGKIVDIPKRSACQIAKAPQCFYFDEIFDIYERAYNDGRENVIDSASLMRLYGHELHSVECGFDNIKITTATDYCLARTLFEARRQKAEGKVLLDD